MFVFYAKLLKNRQFVLEYKFSSLPWGGSIQLRHPYIWSRVRMVMWFSYKYDTVHGIWGRGGGIFPHMGKWGFICRRRG